jgi:lipopolysaccharide/colanic/teichoic acid biosynthesis glycosyltransferase
MFVSDLVDKKGLYGTYGKRIFDLAFSLPFFVLLSPVFLIIGILIKFETPGPVVFTQQRVGLNGRTFKLYKFRTMVEGASNNGPSITGSKDPRITAVGRVLRKYKIDETLQIINVIKGDMSLIGPRPELKEYVDKFKEDYSEILKIRPGITDYASIAFRNEEEILAKFASVEEGYVREIMPEKIKLYRKYLREIGFLTDVKLVLRTILEVVRS